MTSWSWLWTGLKWTGIVLGGTVLVLVVLVVVALVIDLLMRHSIKSSVGFEYDSKYHSNQCSTAVIYLPGLLAHGGISSREVRDTWAQYGGVVAVNYDGGRFRPRQVIQTVSDMIETDWGVGKFRQIVFVGSSMGGLLAHGVHQELRKRGIKIPTGIIALDAPTRSKDLQAPLDKYAAVFRFLPAGPAFNLVPVPRILFRGPKQDSLERTVVMNPQNLNAGVAYSQSRKTSYYLDQVAFIASQHGLARDSLRYCKVAYVRSSKDVDTVRASAFQQWNDAACGQAHHIEVSAKHVAYAESPSVYRDVAFPAAFDALGMRRL